MVRKLTRSSKKLPLLVAVLAILVLGWLVYRHYHHGPFPVSKPSVSTTAKASPSAEADVTDNLDHKQGSSSSPSVTPSSPSGSISILKAAQGSSGDLVIQTALHGISSGTCSLVLTNGSHRINRSADVLYQPSFSTCTGFDIPASSFPVGGTWNMSLSVISSGQTVASTSQTVTISK